MNGSYGGVLNAHAIASQAERGFFYGNWRVGESDMGPDRRFERYRELQSYVGWTDADAERIVAAAPLVEASLLPLIDDFYDEIDATHPRERSLRVDKPRSIGLRAL